MKRVGLLINPVAGMGGRVGLKGTDGMLEEALKRGAEPQAEQRMARALVPLRQITFPLRFLCPAGEMGENLLKDTEVPYQVIASPEKKVTSGRDTVRTAQQMVREDVDCILFAGGDGTARDIYEAVGDKVVVIGVPAGVKIHSPVFARTPRSAGELAVRFLGEDHFPVHLAEVLDIDEEACRHNRVQTSLYGFLQVPIERTCMQNRKAGTPLSERAMQQSVVFEIIDRLIPDMLYLIGPGSTLRLLMESLHQPCSLLGVDLMQNRRTIQQDLSEQDILKAIAGRECKLIVTPTGGQAALFGRGNPQFSPRVLRTLGKENIIVAATMEKIASFHGQPMLVDTGCSEMDQALSGYLRIITGVKQEILYKIG
ncbi:MAG: ATP-NAD kinase [Desulfobulbus propionicus]|nr:MAG: ATP-NAD kinase [Desulfobulbus propionicus]